MEYHPRLRKFHQKYGRLDEEDFRNIFRTPLLVFELTGVSGAPRDFQSYAEAEVPGTSTVLDEDPGSRYQGLHVAQLVKTERNADSRITIGRAATNDIVVPHPSVSKIHACFEPGPKGGWLIRDLSSSYGTVLRNEKLPPEEPVPLRSKDPIELAGSVHATFYSPRDFFAYMSIMAPHLRR